MSNDPNDIPRNLDFFVIEDTQTHLDNLLRSLQELGFDGEVILARSISEGLKLLDLIDKSNTSIDMVISDMHLPDGIGLEILHRLKSHKLLKECPFLVMSTESQQEIIINSFEAGATDYIIKPFKNEELLEKLSFCWEKRVKRQRSLFLKSYCLKASEFPD